MRKSVFCVAKSRNQAGQIVAALQQANFPNSDISALLPDDAEPIENLPEDSSTKAPEGAAIGAASGGVLGGALGWLAGIGSLAIPGVGPFIAAGPIMAAISGAVLGGAAGTLAGTLVGMGIPESRAKYYEERLQEGNILLSVETMGDDEVDRVKTIFKDNGAEDIMVTEETA